MTSSVHAVEDYRLDAVADCASGTVGRAGCTLPKTTGTCSERAGREYVDQIRLETNEGSERVKAACGPNHERLVAWKNRYDPTNLFRHYLGTAS
jgi:hypothetical protein